MTTTKKCAECAAADQVSRVYEDGPGMCAPMGGGWTYWDEQGRQHHHNADRYGQGFRCDKGHHWHESWQHKCWCQQDA